MRIEDECRFFTSYRAVDLFPETGFCYDLAVLNDVLILYRNTSFSGR